MSLLTLIIVPTFAINYLWQIFLIQNNRSFHVIGDRSTKLHAHGARLKNCWHHGSTMSCRSYGNDNVRKYLKKSPLSVKYI